MHAERTTLLVLWQFEQVEAHLFELMKELIIVRRTISTKLTKNAIVDPDVKTASIVGIIMWWLKDGLYLSPDYIAEQVAVMYRA